MGSAVYNRPHRDQPSPRRSLAPAGAHLSAAGAPDLYPGNPSLPREVREKILSTFRHTLNLYRDGKIDDCVIGCDFILKMDPRFGPARRLLEKARNPAADVDVAQLEAVVADTPTRQERAGATDPERLLVRAAESVNARDFDAAIAAAEQVLAVLPGNRNAQEIMEKARRKKAAQPQFEASRQRAIAALDGNRPGEARGELEKMRGLDPEHPAVALLERRLGSGAVAIPPPPAFLSEPGSSGFEQEFGLDAQEPEVGFHPGATRAIESPPADLSASFDDEATNPALKGLSLDSLTFDSPPIPATPPGSLVHPPDAAAAPGPLAPRGSPGDLWGEAPPETETERPLLEQLDLSPKPLPAPIPRAAPTSFELPPLEPEPAADKEIESLLKQGDEASLRGDRQQAIEIWSRIFLIDINNVEAVTRIEQARQEMAEGNRAVSDGLKTGRERFEGGDLVGARDRFLAVLAADENEPTARFYLDRIQEEFARAAAPPPAAAAEPQPRGVAAPEFGAEKVKEKVKESAAAPAKRPRRALALKLPPRRVLVAMLGALALLTVGGIFFFVLRSRGGEPVAAAPGNGPTLESAMELFREGKVPETIAALRQIPPGHPDYAAAQKLLASLQKQSSPGARAAGTEPSGPSDAAPAEDEPARLRGLAEKALAERRYIEALKNFNLAAPAFASDLAFNQARAAAMEKVTQLTPAVKLYNVAEYETAIPILWRIYSEDRENQDARSYLQRAYYNQGIAQLQNGLFEKAIESFGEVLTLDPQDDEAARHKRFAQLYEAGDLDLMGRIYVRHVQPRP